MNTEEVLQNLVQKANDKGTIQLIFTLLRLCGIETYNIDPLDEFADKLQKTTTKEELDPLIRKTKDIWAIIFNLVLLSEKKEYDPNLMTNQPVEDYYVYGKNLVLGKGIDEKTINEFIPEIDKANFKELKTYFEKFLEIYKVLILSFANFPKFHKQQNFEVFEVLAQNDGLRGFKLHFSNGTNASFTRTEKGTMAINLSFRGDKIEFYVGITHDLIKDWRVGTQRLFEVGLDGKYNVTGEWKPIIHPGDDKAHLDIGTKAKELGQGNDDAEGIFYYMLATGYPVIEFIVKTEVKLPERELLLDNGINLVNIDASTELIDVRKSHIYDGWLRLQDISPEGVLKGLEEIQRTINSFGFSFDSVANWRLKYPVKNHSRGLTTPKKNDVKIFKDINNSFSQQKNLVIDSAVEWYQKGLTSNNIYNAFLSYHISIEGLAGKLVSGELDASSVFNFPTKEKYQEDIKQQMDEYYNKYYATDPKMFATKAYLDVVGSMKRNLEKAFENVFGANSVEKELYFGKNDSLWDLRGSVAHGDYSDWDFDKRQHLHSKIHIIKSIARDFIYRIVFQIKSSDKTKYPSSSFLVGMSFDNPLSTLISTREDIFPTKDWKIKPEWFDL